MRPSSVLNALHKHVPLIKFLGPRSKLNKGSINGNPKLHPAAPKGSTLPSQSLTRSDITTNASASNKSKSDSNAQTGGKKLPPSDGIIISNITNCIPISTTKWFYLSIKIVKDATLKQLIALSKKKVRKSFSAITTGTTNISTKIDDKAIAYEMAEAKINKVS
ncbi:13680_t:CDS:2 [Entrophospora sp. SA101]|nr:9879_t:CDS:2 [Entrophospora sp. SA101]CAJ0753611.1 13680_t:CDS:2 [Entrophospora sp. SA101]CAJ0833663.1 6421_t:CDS:2 [Entrophospora sp. SA101]